MGLSPQSARTWCGMVLRSLMVVVLLTVVLSTGLSAWENGPGLFHLAVVSALCFWALRALAPLDKEGGRLILVLSAEPAAPATPPPSPTRELRVRPLRARRKECPRQGQGDWLWRTAC